MKNSHALPEVAIVGMGLIGGSLGLGLRRRGIAVRGIDRRADVLASARARNGATRVTRILSEGARGAGLVVLCVPFREVSGYLGRLAGLLPPETVVTDVTSVKSSVLAIAERTLRYPGRFLGGHPMAGSERSGFTAASSSLFLGKPCILTPAAGTDHSALTLVAKMWRLVGAIPVKMTAARHDRTVARVSHLPHALAATLSNYILRNAGLRRVASGSFLDATRVASSSPDLWRGIFMSNRREAGRAILEYSRLLRKFGNSVRSGRSRAIENELRGASAKRRSLGRRSWRTCRSKRTWRSG